MPFFWKGCGFQVQEWSRLTQAYSGDRIRTCVLCLNFRSISHRGKWYTRTKVPFYIVGKYEVNEPFQWSHAHLCEGSHQVLHSGYDSDREYKRLYLIVWDTCVWENLSFLLLLSQKICVPQPSITFAYKVWIHGLHILTVCAFCVMTL